MAIEPVDYRNSILTYFNNIDRWGEDLIYNGFEYVDEISTRRCLPRLDEIRRLSEYMNDAIGDDRLYRNAVLFYTSASTVFNLYTRRANNLSETLRGRNVEGMSGMVRSILHILMSGNNFDAVPMVEVPELYIQLHNRFERVNGFSNEFIDSVRRNINLFENPPAPRREELFRLSAKMLFLLYEYIIVILDELFNRVQPTVAPVIVYRMVNLSEDYINSNLTCSGDRIPISMLSTFKNHLSTSYSIDSIISFMSSENQMIPVFCVIILPRGSRVLNVENISLYPIEREILLNEGNFLVCKKKIMKNEIIFRGLDGSFVIHRNKRHILAVFEYIEDIESREILESYNVDNFIAGLVNIENIIDFVGPERYFRMRAEDNNEGMTVIDDDDY